MSKLDDLVAELCPDGVEYKSLEEVTRYSKNRIKASDVKDYNYVGVDNLLPNKRGKTSSSYVPKNGVLIEYQINDILIGNIRPYLKKIWLATNNGGTNGDVLTIIINAEARGILSPFYLYYILSSDNFFNYDMQHSKGSKMPRGDKASVMRYPIPIPPLPIQEEIVRILDKFTTLEAELEAELEKRKKQYEYYRDSLLTFSDDVEQKSIGEVFEMKAGKNISASEISSTISDGFTFPCYGGNGLRGYVKCPSHNGSFVIIGRQGALCGNVKRVAGEFYATEHAVVTTAKPGIDINWAFYILKTMNLNQYATKSAQPGLSVRKIENITISVPPLEEQERIVAILDRFDTLVNDISQGLPAEIEARRKQYEYYRDKLLTFKEKES